MGGYAWVTLATNNSYSLGALVLAHSLKKAKTIHKMVVLISPAVSEPMREQLQTVFDLVKVVDVLDSKDEAHLALMKRPDLGITFTKIHCWRLVEFEKCVFLDADTLVVRNCDELFEREEFSAAPDVSWPDCFNSGVFVYRPSIETFNKLLQFAVENRSFDGGDQGLLNQFFSDWATEDIKKHLPFVYNLTSIAAYSYIPAFKHYGSETRIVHFIGEGKPWLQQLDVATRTVVPGSGSEHLAPLLQQWWDVFCEKVHPNLDKSLESNNDGMLQPPVDACSNSVAIALTDEPQTARLTEPCTPYREKDDFRQYNLPYQPFDVKGSSGELLNVEFMLVSSPDKEDDPLEGDKTEDSFESNLEGGEGGKKEQTKEEEKKQEKEDGGDKTEDEPVGISEEGNKTNEEKKEEDGDQNQQEEPPPVEEEKDYNSFFPDENYLNNYMEHNVMMYQPFEAHHETVNCEREPEQEVPSLQRFLAIPENDQRQSGNVPDVPNVEEECNPPKSPPEDNPPPRETTPPKEKPVTEKRELAKSKSASYIHSDFKPTEVSPPRSIWKSQPNLNVDPNRRFSMPKLKPILPKQNSFSKSFPSVMPKVTLYTEFLMSSEYKDPIDLPNDKIGFVESHIHKAAGLRRCKSDADIRSKFGPLPYAFFPEVQKPVVLKKSPPRHLDNEIYDLSKCKRQMGNKPKPKNADERRENIQMLPALKPIAPAKDKKSTLIKKRKSKELSPGVGGREKILKREPKIAREKRRESKITPRNVSTSANVETLDQILQKLREFSKDYQHFFGMTWGDKKKTVKCKNAEVQAGENESGECRASEVFETVSKSVSTKSMETQTGKEAKQDGSEFRQFRNYVKDKRETSQKGLLSIQDILGEFEQPRTETNGSSNLKNRVVIAEITAEQAEDDAAPAQEYSKHQATVKDEGRECLTVKAASKEEIESKNIPDPNHKSTSQNRSTAEVQKDEKTFPESNSKPEVAQTCHGSEDEETRKELDSVAAKSEEEHPDCSKLIKTPENGEKPKDSLHSGQLPNLELQSSNENDDKTKTETPNARTASETTETNKELQSEKTESEEERPDGREVIKTFENTYNSKDSLDSGRLQSPELKSSKENDHETKTEARSPCLASETSETSKELELEAEKSEEIGPDITERSDILQTPENGDKSKDNVHSGQLPNPELQNSNENDEKTKSEVSMSCLASDIPEPTKEIDSVTEKCEELGSNKTDSSEVFQTSKNGDKLKDNLNSGGLPSPEVQSSSEKDEKTKPETPKLCLTLETPETIKELDSEADKSKEIGSNKADLSEVFQTPENGNKSSESLPCELPGPELEHSNENGEETKEEHSRKNGCDYPPSLEQKERDPDRSISTTTDPIEPETIKNGVSSENAVSESAPLLSSQEITQPDQKGLPEEAEKPQQWKNKTNGVERPKNPNEILCVPDFETPRSSRVTLPMPKTAADQSETVVAGENLKSRERNGQANGRDSPEETNRIVGKKKSGRKTPPSSPKPSGPPQNGGLQDLNGGSGIAGAIAQLSLDAGAQSAGSAAASAAQQEYLRRQNWETGNMDYMGRDSFDNIWSKICQTLEAKETEEAAGGSPAQTTAEDKKPEAIPTTEDPVTLATILQKCPEFIETLPGDPAAGPVEDDEIIFSKPESRQSCLTNITEVEEGRTESAEATGKVKLSDILQPQSTVGSKSENIPDKKVGGTVEGPKAEKVQSPTMPTTQITPPTPTPEQVQSPIMPTAEKTPASPKEQAPAVTPAGGAVQPPVTPIAEKTQPPTTPEGSKAQPPTTPTPAQVPPPTTPVADKVQLPETPTGVKSPATPTAEKTPILPPAAAEKVQPPATPTPQPPAAPTPQPPATPTPQPMATPTTEKPPSPATPTTEKAVPPVTPTAEKIQPPPTSEGSKAPPPTPVVEQVQPPTAPTAVQIPPPVTPVPDKVEIPKAPAEVKAQPEVLPADVKPTQLPQTEKPESKTVEIPPPTQTAPLPNVEAQTTCTTVAIPSPPIMFPGAPFEEKGKPEKGKKLEDKPEVVSEPIPLPPPDSPTQAPTQEPTAKVSDSSKEEGKQKKGVFTKILEMVGVAPKEKNGGEAPKSVFYDGQGGAEEAKEVAKSVFYDVQGGVEEAKEVEQASEVKEKPEDVRPSDLEQKTTEPQKKEELPPPKAEEAVKKEPPKPEEAVKKEPPKAEETVKKEPPKAEEAVKKEPPKAEKVVKTEPPKAEKVVKEPPKAEENVKKEEKSVQEEKKDQEGKQGKGPKQKPARGSQGGKKGQARKSPSPKLTMPQSPPATAVTTPTPPPQTEIPPMKNPELLKVDDTILETPPVTDAPKESIAEAVKGKVEDIIGKAKSEVESLLQDRRSAEKEVGESTDLINTMKLMMGAEEPGKPEEVEELKVTSEEERKRHKGEVVTSKLSDQILKAIPPPRRKAISEATASTSSIPKTTPAPEQQKTAPGESKSKTSKPSSIPVPPPRSKGKPSPPKGKGKK